MDEATADRWLVCKRPQPKARHRLIAFTWAGGTAAVFYGWDIPGVEVVAVHLPGRDK
jgi:surfactin synthase thioesterase subunit